ncbi:MAG: helix-turn-helix transcriptional regulator [Clostridia bacterium]|jgi:putative transcriptional regulator|nr:helix-turn-helix transcriptional regulator [Clostridia bacterium]
MFDERVKIAREAAGLSQAEVATAIGVTQAAYSYIERDMRDPSLSIAVRLAKTLGVSLDYLVGNDKTN